MKRGMVLLIAVILCLSLAACGKAPEAEQGLQETSASTTDAEGSAQMQQQSDSCASGANKAAVSYTHLTLPTMRTV